MQELLGLAGVVGDGQGRGDDLRGQRVHARLAIVRRDCCRKLLGSLNNVSPDFQEEVHPLRDGSGDPFTLGFPRSRYGLLYIRGVFRGVLPIRSPVAGL